MVKKTKIISLIVLIFLIVLTPIRHSFALHRPDRQDVRPSQWWLEALEVTKGHQIHQGNGVKVCLIDTGVDSSHPDFAKTKFGDGVDVSGYGANDGLKPVGPDLDGPNGSRHGTSMAAFIAANPEDDKGFLGIAPESTIVSVSITPNTADNKGGTPDEVFMKAFRHCIKNDARIINMSGGWAGDSEALQFLMKNDAIFVEALGNDRNKNSSIRLGIVGVGGVTQNLTIDPKSDVASKKIHSSKRDFSKYRAGTSLVAPYSTRPSRNPDGTTNPDQKGFLVPRPGGKYSEITGGTSGAAAMVSGVMALVWAKYPELDSANVINRVLQTATPLGEGPVPQEKYGWGLPNAYKALTADVPHVDENPLGSYATGNGGVWFPEVRGAPVTQADLDAIEEAEIAKEEAAKLVPVWWVLGVFTSLVLIGLTIWLMRRNKTRRSKQELQVITPQYPTHQTPPLHHQMQPPPGPVHYQPPGAPLPPPNINTAPLPPPPQ